MKKTMMLFCICLFHGAAAYAEEATLVRLDNPRVSTGVEIGDVLERTLVIEAKSPYVLPKSSLPLKGEREDGIEIVGVALKSEKAGDGQRYELKLSYQVFAAASKAQVLHLPAMNLALSGGDAAVDIGIPAWHFWYSPLVAGDIHTARRQAQPQRKPALLETGVERLGIALAALLLGLGGLVYINAERRWLPWMGGNFAQAYRQLRKLPLQSGNHVQALVYLHQAFNQVYGQTLFRRQLDGFFAENPQYQSLATEIEDFFQYSETLLFTRESVDSAVLIRRVQQLCRRLRDCERRVT
ncbi:mxaA protein [Methylobacillus rhizosphaerae]|uniref:MxaA protein n=1 Tax=Methylobacillus rhizosphaerae TaxID=551994 RepID=A0A239AEL4_9PROT|nr:hypothetical protein [Methylobacillus rhizosphaerae]SNR93468.1 mxaA protein [Methylobacillus rhizosphaerae]